MIRLTSSSQFESSGAWTQVTEQTNKFISEFRNQLYYVVCLFVFLEYSQWKYTDRSVGSQER